ncbi:RNA polymerase sigma factor [Thermoactinospora rubra]|uniref:RNA polymerase sigma factor n=1 Tax=Thermoactinospora rubra TaxID=1088767 RepID=UPI000A0F979C|nr:sigma-70 family RNA polymerase sigma factor [Thermoactinospora rubra]
MRTETDRARFEAVYTDTYDQILGYAVRRCERPEDAADVVAETYAIAWRRLDRLPEGDEARLWLYGVARNVLANHRRGRLRRERVAELTAEIADVYAGTSGGDGVEFRDIARAFRELSDGDRELLSLVAWEGLDHAQLAKVLDISRNAVRIRLHRARRRFAKALARGGVTVNHVVMESL